VITEGTRLWGRQRQDVQIKTKKMLWGGKEKNRPAAYPAKEEAE